MARFDVVVIGAGAAGMMAALQAARRGRRTVLLEKNQKPGLKILISGGGRCNLTTTKGGKALEREYGERRGRWLRHAMRSFQPPALRQMFEDAGVPMQEEDLDKIFPVSGRAADVVDALLRLLEDAGVELHRGVAVSELAAGMPDQDVGESAAAGFTVTVRGGSGGGAVHAAPAVIVATGGLSYPKTGATGDGYRWVQGLGHSLVRPVPHLAPLPVEETWVTGLAGIVLNHATLSVAVRPERGGGKELCRRQRPVLFTHKGLSGPAAMDLAGFIEERDGGCEVRFDFAPTERLEDLEAEWLAATQAHGRRGVAAALPRDLPERLRHALAANVGADGVSLAELKKDVRRRLLHNLKQTRVPVEQSLGFAHAEVTRGGVPLDEVDARTMASKVCPGLFLCGEILDIDGPIGGFNFQAAFATGRLAGLHA